MGEDLKPKELESKKWLTSFLRYQVQMVLEFLWLSKLAKKGKQFLYLKEMRHDQGTCEMEVNSCELGQNFVDLQSV